jgi:hypothetical protein
VFLVSWPRHKPLMHDPCSRTGDCKRKMTSPAASLAHPYIRTSLAKESTDSERKQESDPANREGRAVHVFDLVYGIVKIHPLIALLASC